MCKILIVFFIVFFSAMSFKSLSFEQSNSQAREYTPTVLISIDGFAQDYIKYYQPPNIVKLANSGVSAKSLLSVFPTKTFPNHLSIVTGNYPSRHGMIHNSFYNRELRKNYKMGIGKFDERWVTSPTLWSIAEKNNIKTAIYFWPESEINVAQYKASYSLPYKHNTPNIDRFNQIVDWLKLPIDARPELVLGYFSTIDSAGHDFGSRSEQLGTTINEFDVLLGEFLNRLEREIPVPVNIIIVSDHGMVDIKNKSLSYFHLFDGVETENVVNGQTQLYVYLSDTNKEDETLAKINENMRSKESQYINVYKYDNFPKHWHFNTRSSVMPNLILEVVPPYTFSTTSSEGQATHGFDPKLSESLNAIFIADGPSFKKKLNIEAFENIHILPLILGVYGIDVDDEIDGKKSVLYPILQ